MSNIVTWYSIHGSQSSNLAAILSSENSTFAIINNNWTEMTENSPQPEQKEDRIPTLEELLADEALLQDYNEYAKKHLCNEHLDFYRAVERYKYAF